VHERRSLFFRGDTFDTDDEASSRSVAFVGWNRTRTDDRDNTMATTQTPVDQATVEEILAEWPEEPTEIAEDVVEQYGRPDEAAPSELCWYDNGPWKRTEMYRDGVPHNFPKEHTDYLKQVINYPVPAEKVDDITTFDGSVYVDRTNGEMAAKCDKEPMNVLALNLAHDIVTGDRTVEEARQDYAMTALKQMMGGNPDYTESLQFSYPADNEETRDLDESVVTEAMKEEVKEMLGGEDEVETG
jgi:hypothetical protein